MMTTSEIDNLVELLKKLEPGLLPFTVFREVTRVYVTAIVEIVPLRLVDGKTQVLMTRRERDDLYWPKLWHTPGTVLRATDKKGDLVDAFERIMKGELGYQGEYVPVFVYQRFSQSTRGSEFSAVHYVEISGEAGKGEWFDVEKLPTDWVETQKEMIEKSVECFKKDKRFSD